MGKIQIACSFQLLDKSNMPATLKQRVAERLEELDRNPFEAARKGKLERSFVNDILIDKKESVQNRSLPKLAAALDWTLSELMEAIEAEETIKFGGLKKKTVPLKGYVGAGAAMYFASADDPAERVPAPDDTNDQTVAVEVRGESLGSLFDRWLVFYDEVRDQPSPSMLNKLCVVGLADGRVLVKQLKRGQLEGHFNLLSNVEPPIYDQIVEWAAVVKQMTPR